MIVVFDSNIWYSQLGLQSAPGAAVRFFLKHHGARIAIPEVIRLEVSHNLSKRLLEHIEHIRTDYRQLLTAFGTLREIVLPSEEQVRSRVSELFASLGVDQIDVPFSLESARSSFLKTIEKVPPSQNKQQFKDGVLWADCLSLLHSDSVVLVTDDKAFYEDQQHQKGLAKNLRLEAESFPNAIRVLPALSDLLEKLQTPAAINANDLQNAFLELYRESVHGTLERNGFEIDCRTSASIKPYATEDPSMLFIEFSMSFSCKDLTEEGRTEAVLYLKGDGTYIPSAKVFGNLRNFGEYLQFRMLDGTVTERQNHVLYADGIVLGHREVTNVTRYPLANE